MRSQIKKITTGKSGEIYSELLDAVKIYAEPHEFVGDIYRDYLGRYPPDNPSLNGRIFEYLICETLARHKIVPFYYQAKFEHVPNADFDVVLYDKLRPVVLTMKVSLRERYKQADLEGLALRQVYRRATSYLITLSEEAHNVEQKISEGSVSGLDRCVLANTPEYTELLNELAQRSFSLAEMIMPISGTAFPVKDI